MSGEAPTAAARRTRYLVRTAALLVAVAIACAAGATLAARHALRLDVTATRDNALSARTLATLARLDGPHAVIVSADGSRLDRGARRRLADLLDEFARAAPDLSVRWIDTSGDAGRDAFAATIARLAREEAELAAAHRAAIGEAARAAEELPRDLAALSDTLKAVAESLDPFDPNRARTEQNAAVVRTLAAQLAPAAESARRAEHATIAGTPIPDAPAAADHVIAPLREVARACEALAAAASPPGAAPPGEAGEANARLASLAARARDRAATAADGLARQRPLRALTIARLLQARDAVLVTGPAGITAVRFESIFPEGGGAIASNTARFAGEELIASALATLGGTPAPLVVFVHAENSPMFGPGGAPSPSARRAFAHLLDRLALRRIDTAEWAVASQPARPDRAALDPSGARPIVWIVMPAPSRAAIDPRHAAAAADRSARIGRLGQALAALIADGEAVMVSIDPSDLPSVGEPDPVAAALAALGLRADSARPLIRREPAAAGPIFWTTQMVRAADEAVSGGAHPVAKAIAGLPVALAWATPIEAMRDGREDGPRVAPLLMVQADANVWGESQWFSYRYAGAAQPLAPLALSDPPAPDGARDATVGPWIVAAAAERTHPRGAAGAGGANRPQRLVAVASPSWFDDYFTQASEEIDARPVRLFPGNAELFEASVLWLAGLDELIGAGPRAREISRLPMLTDRQTAAIRWALIAGLPAAVLMLGAIVHLMRRSPA